MPAHPNPDAFEILLIRLSSCQVAGRPVHLGRNLLFVCKSRVTAKSALREFAYRRLFGCGESQV